MSGQCDRNMMNMLVANCLLLLSVAGRVVRGSVSFGESLSHFNSHCVANP